ncbi:MAG: MarC family protein [Marmoricola sp.]
MESITVAAAALGALLPITNPVGGLAIYAGLTGGYSKEEVRRQGLRTGVYVFLILAVFALFGSLLLSAFGISLGALQIAGGLVVAHAGFTMLVANPVLRKSEKEDAESKPDVAFSPMALPMVAGPGAIGVVIALTAEHPHWSDRIGVLIACALIGVFVAVLLGEATPIVDRLGPTGIGALMRILGFLILAIGVELVLHGLRATGF